MAAIERGRVLSWWRGRAPKPAAPVCDWTQQELAQFYRVEWALSQAHISVDCDRGISDEGDPWFAFCRSSDGEVIIHIAREGRTYLLAGFLSGRIQRGSDFNEIVERLLAEHPAKSLDKRGESNVVMHPATMLALLVMIAFMQNSESKAATADNAAEAAAVAPVVLPQGSTVGAARTGSSALAGSIASLTATFELSQAMTILRVASLLNGLPDIEHATPAQGSLSAGFGIGAPRQVSNASTTPIDTASAGLLLDDHAAPAATQMTSASPLPAQPGGVEKLLEIVAKLWTFPDAKFAVPAGLSADAAAAFFAHDAGAADAITIAAPVQPKDIYRAHAAPAGDAGGEARPAEPTAASPSLTIVHTSGSSVSVAQTVLKLSFPGQDDLIVHAATLDSSAQLYTKLSELVERAKETVSPGDGIIHLEAGTVVSGSEHGIEAGKHADTESSDSAAKAPAPSTEHSYTTVIGDGVITHIALDKTAEADAARAIAAFKEDVGNYSIAVNGKDVIFFSADAVTNHAEHVVVELWQFQDGSSIGLVGLSVDGHLPYSL